MPTLIPMQPEKEHQSIRLFENDLLERLSHVHPITPLLMWGPISAWLFWRSLETYQLPGAPVLAIAIAGAFVWTLSEYCLHRYLFHFPAKSKLGKWPNEYKLACYNGWRFSCNIKFKLSNKIIG